MSISIWMNSIISVSDSHKFCQTINFINPLIILRKQGNIMADWKCVSCGWTNGGTRTHCVRCGLVQTTQEEFNKLEKGKSEMKEIYLQIEQYRASLVQKWEYEVLFTGLDADKKWIIQFKGESYPYNQVIVILDKLGTQGWELVGVSSNVGSEKPWLTTVSLTYTAGEQFYFKRPCASLPEDLQKQVTQIIDEVPPQLRSRLPFVP
jgi:hypothetical protein